MNVMVFGAGGYIGIPLCNALKERGHQVIGVDRFFFGKKPDLPILKGDIRTFVIERGPEVVIDVAGLSNDATAEIDPDLTRFINEDGGKRIASLAKAAGVRRYIYSSSASVYGHGHKMYLTERDELIPLTAYAKSKVEVEKHLNGLMDQNFETIILRNATVFGVSERMRFDLAVNVMTMRAWRDKEIYIMGGGLQYRPFIHVKDVVSVFCEMVERPAAQVARKTFNVGSDGMNFTISEIASMVKQKFRDAKLHQIPDNTDHRTYHLSFKRLSELGISCKFSIESGINEVTAALNLGTIKADDPTAVTLAHYKNLIDWERRLNEIRLDGKIL